MKALLFWTLSRAGVTHQHRRAGRRGVPLLPATAEADPINFAPRVKIPVLMINGRHDFAEPVDKRRSRCSPGSEHRKRKFGDTLFLCEAFVESVGSFEKLWGGVMSQSLNGFRVG